MQPHNMDSLVFVSPFSYFDREGACTFPSPDLVRRNRGNGLATTLQLDANICLLMANYAQGQADAYHATLIEHLLLLIEMQLGEAGVNVAPFFGCLELGCRRRSAEIDQERLSSITSAVNRALARSATSIVRGEGTSPHLRDDIVFSDQSIEPFVPMLRYAYACFLKVMEIRTRGFLKDRVVKNFIEFYDWMESMNKQASMAAQAALALLGGAKEAEKLLSPRKGKTPLDVAWGSAWDVLHAFLAKDYLPHLQIHGHHEHVVFVTNDAAAAFVASSCSPRVAFLDGGLPHLSMTAIRIDFPYLTEEKQAMLNEKLQHRQMETILRIVRTANSIPDLDSATLDREIDRLEQLAMENFARSAPTC